MTRTAQQGFRLGIYVFKDAQIVDFAALYGVFPIADAGRPAPAQASRYRRDGEYAAPGARPLEIIN